MTPIRISFSGGRTSAAMTHLLTRSIDRPFAVVFANTGLEHPATLDFVRDVGVWCGVEIHWIEATFGAHGIGVRARRVCYDTAARGGEPFRALTRKHGLPGPGRPWCTSRLKVDTMQDYTRRALGWRVWDTAIGIRADEMDRVSQHHVRDRVVYPLLDAGYDRAAVEQYLLRHGAPDLRLPGAHMGNCVTCWKKSARKLLTIARETPEAFAPFAEMERVAAEQGRIGTFFRDHQTTADILRRARTEQFRPYSDAPPQGSLLLVDDLDLGGGCGESCEAYADEEPNE